MFEQSQPYDEMIEFIIQLKSRYNLNIAAISNEAREINDYRIKKFKLARVFDCFISSCIVNLRKPDPEIFRLALDIVHAQPEQVIYIENTPTFVHSAESLGIRSVLHTDCASTRASLAKLGLPLV